MDFIHDPQCWVIFTASSVAMIISAQFYFNSIQLEDTDKNKDKLSTYSLLILFVGFIISTHIIFLFGRKESLYCFGASLIMGLCSMVIRYINMDHAKIDIFQLRMKKERNREEIKFFFIQKMERDNHFKAFIKEYSLTEGDLDDYFEILSYGWPLDELLPVLMNEKVLRTYFAETDMSKGELLKNIQKLKLHPYKMRITDERLKMMGGKGG
jgi:hypothetical protein